MPGGEPSNPNIPIPAGVCPHHVEAFGRLEGKVDKIDATVSGIALAVREHEGEHKGMDKAKDRIGGHVSSWTAVAGLILAILLAVGSAVYTFASADRGVDEASIVRAMRRAMRTDSAGGPVGSAPHPGPAGGS